MLLPFPPWTIGLCPFFRIVIDILLRTEGSSVGFDNSIRFEESFPL